MVFDTHLQNSLSVILNSAISHNIFPGAVVGIVQNREKAFVSSGSQTYINTSPKITAASIFDVASVTKTIPTSLLALKLLEEKKISLDTKIVDILPVFRGKWKEKVTVFNLLTHTVDFGLQLSKLKHHSVDEIYNKILTCDLKSKPGTSYMYINSTSIVLGLVIETVSKKKLPDIAGEYFFQSLGMNDTSFDTSLFPPEHIVPTEIDSWRGGEIRGVVHDESAYVLSTKCAVGSAGLFSSAQDLLVFLEMLLSGGTYKGKKYFNKQTLELMSKNQLVDIKKNTGLGWEMEKEFMGTRHSVRTVGKTGFTGCCIFIDFEREIGIVILSNAQYPRRKKSHSITHVRSEIIDTILAS